MVFLDLTWAPFIDATLLQEYEETTSNPILARAASMADSGIEQSGYMDIKQPPKVKGRKLKSWKKKWVVLHEMSIPAAGKAAAKVDVYADEKTAVKCPSDKHTFILEYVTRIQAAKSKTHAHAFEIVENEPVLLMAGPTELESQAWISAFRKIFWPQEIEEHCYNVSIVPNENSKKLSLEGEYLMNITPEVIGIESETHNSYEWSLSMLKRFHLDTHPENKEKKVLVIECGPRSECGEATFLFQADDVPSILASIKKNIFIAINMKKCATATTSTKPNSEQRGRNSVISRTSSVDDRPRSGTLSSIHSSEQRFRDLLDPPMPESKRKRLGSSSSDPRISGSDTTSVHSSHTQPSMPSPDIVTDFDTKKRHSVTFENLIELTNKETTDIFSLPNETNESDGNEDLYNRVLLNPPKSATNNIITTFTIAQPGYQTKVLLDDKGYSHVSFKDKTPVVEGDKSRSPSNISSQSSMSVRSASVGSRDSGIQYQAADQPEHQEKGIASKRSTNSFDSAVSTSSTTETVEMDTINSTPTKLTVAIEAVQVDSAGNVIDSNTGECGIYQDVSIDDENICSTEIGKKTPKLLKSNSTGDFQRDENEYEDLEKFQKGKKDLWKHLGIDPRIDPTSIPPALPERPSSSKMKRKFQNQDRKLFTLPFARHKTKKNKEVAVSISSSSDSDSESMKDNKNNADITVKNWPLGNNSVIVGNNEIYQPVAIERYLNDNDDNSTQNVRERSSSLNLNMSTSLKRASLRLGRSKNKADKESAMWRHNRNASMNVEVLQRMNDKSADTNLKKRVEMALQNMPLGGSVFESLSESKERDLDIIRLNRSDSEHSSSPSEEEPIYAEVGPSSKRNEGDQENPFPDIEPWKAHEDQNSFLNRTHYENDDSMDNSKSGDFLNQGFVTSENNNTEIKSNVVKNQGEAVLIDFSDNNNKTTEAKNINTPTSAVDIFKMEFDPLFSTTQSSHVTHTSSSTNDIVDIFHIGVFTPQPMNRQNSACFTAKMEKVVETSELESDISIDEINSENSSKVNDTIYMDMTQCKNESIYVMPSTVKK